jgi:hypothetical protein
MMPGRLSTAAPEDFEARITEDFVTSRSATESTRSFTPPAAPPKRGGLSWEDVILLTSTLLLVASLSTMFYILLR